MRGMSQTDVERDVPPFPWSSEHFLNHEVKLRAKEAQSFVSCERSPCLRLSDSVKNVRFSATTSVFQHTPSGFLFELDAEAMGTLVEARVDLLGLPDVDGMFDMIDR